MNLHDLDFVRIAKLVQSLGACKASLASKGVEVPEGALMDDLAGLIDQVAPGTGAVTSVNGKTGAVTITASGLKAAIRSMAWQSVTKKYQSLAAQAIQDEVEPTPPKDYLWALGQGMYFLRHADGVHLMARVRIVPGMLVTAYGYFPAEIGANNLINGGLWIGNSIVLQASSNADGTQIYIAMNGRDIATKKDVEIAIKKDGRAIAKEEAEAAVAASKLDNPASVSAIGTTLEKVWYNRRRYIKVGILNCAELRKLLGKHDISLHFIMISRRRGKGFHRWHPTTWENEVVEANCFKIGYGQMESSPIDPNISATAFFPPIPNWMPNEGWLETERMITKEDLDRGFILIDPAIYFLPMIKPVGSVDPVNWGDKISFVSTQSVSGEIKGHKPIMCSWMVAVDGREVGRPLHHLRVGCSRNREHKTTVIIQNGAAELQDLYVSIR